MRKRTPGKFRLLAAAVLIVLTASILAGAGCVKNGEEKLPRTNIAPPALTAQPEIDDAGAEVIYSVNRTLSSDMVVQRNAYFNVFGTSESVGGVIYGEFMGEKRYATVGDDGRWLMQFSSHEATAEPQTLKIYPKNGKTTEFSDILVGDVWVVSGQSNAELTLGQCLAATPGYEKEIKKEDNIRIFVQTRQAVMDAIGEIDLTETQDEPINEKWKWEKTTPSATIWFSALGYYFAKELSRSVDVPLGLVMAAAGGSTLHELMPGPLAAELGFSTAPSVPAGGFYNSLIYPFTKNRITGMLFYQGESECGGGQYLNYASNLVRTVSEYRKVWGIDFPLIEIQLSSHLGEGTFTWPELPQIRAAQFSACRMMDNAYIVTAMDQGFRTGDPDWAHPIYKLEIGRRAARIAAWLTYGQGSEDHALAPEPDKVVWNKDGSITVTFKHVGDGLKTVDGGNIRGLSARDEYGDSMSCDFETVDGSTIRIIPSRSAVSVCYGMNPDGSADKANLCSGDGIPMPAFVVEK